MISPSLDPIGLGTYSDAERSRWYHVVGKALDIGYRHFDTGSVYGNERYIGAAVKDADVDRDSVVLATKTVHPETKSSPDQLPRQITDRLTMLGVTYIDILYVHWPLGTYEPAATLDRFVDARQNGRINHIGVSNFTREQLDVAHHLLGDELAVHQAEFHPLLQQTDLVAHAQANDYQFVAHTPLAKGRVRQVPTLQTIAAKHDVTPEVVSLAWICSHDNVVAIPKAMSLGHLRANRQATDLELDKDDCTQIERIARRERVVEAPHLS